MVDLENISNTKELIEATIKLNAELEPDLTAEFALKRYNDFLDYVKAEMDKDPKDKNVGVFFILAIQDFMMSCSIKRFYSYIGTMLINMSIEAAERIDLDDFCSGVVTYLKQCDKYKHWILSRNITSVSSHEEMEKILEEVKDENNIRYN